VSLLSIDIGNTNALCLDHSSGESFPFNESINFNQYPKIIFSSVLNPKDMKSKFQWFNFDQYTNAKDFIQDNTFLKMPINYTTHSIGIDRVLCAYSIFKSEAQGEHIVIDAGTFTTIDHVNSKGFQSGFIAPGIDGYISLYNEGSKLPPLSKRALLEDNNKASAHNTNEAIIKSIKHSYLGIINSFNLPNAHITLTGGNYKFFEEFLDIKALKKPLLIHQAMKFLA